MNLQLGHLKLFLDIDSSPLTESTLGARRYQAAHELKSINLIETNVGNRLILTEKGQGILFDLLSYFNAQQ